MINFLVDVNDCGGLLNIVALIRRIINIASILIPIILIGYGLIDLGKAVMAGKEDEMKKCQGTLIKRVIYAIIVFLIVQLVVWATGLVGQTSWKDCWDAAGNYKGNIVEDVAGGIDS